MCDRERCYPVIYFAVYINNLIIHLKTLVMEFLWVRYLLVLPCIIVCGLKNLVNICKLYGDALDVKFDSVKSQHIILEVKIPEM